jgi:uncharacterized repeat protein (TIGR01451 family)
MPGSEPKVRKDSRLFADLCSELLNGGHSVRFRVHGESMQPNLLEGDEVVVAPTDTSTLRRGEVVLTDTENGLKVHRIAHIDTTVAGVFTRGDSGQENDPLAQQIFGKVIAAEREGKLSATTGNVALLRHSSRLIWHQMKLSATRRFLEHVRAMCLFVPFLLIFATFFAVTPSSAQTLAITNVPPSPASALGGGTVSFTQVLSNTSGASSPATVTVKQTVPTGLTLTSVTWSGSGTWTCPGTGATCTLTGNYPSGSTTTFTANFNVETGNNNTGTTTFTESVKASWNTGASSTTTSATVTLAADLSIAQVAPAPPSPLAPDNTYSLLESVTNNSNDTVPSGTMTVTMTIPTNTTYQTGTGTNWACGSTATTITCTYNHTLGNAATSSTLTITMLLNAGAPSGTVTNTLTTQDSGFTDPIPGNNTLTVSLTAQAPDLALAATPSVSQVAPDTTYSDAEVVTNNGPTNTVSGKITVTETAPANTTYQSFTGTNWNCTGTTTITCTYNAALNSGVSASTLTLTFLVAPGTASGTITNTATVADSDFTDPNLSNNTASASVTVAAPDLALSETASPSEDAPGANYTYSEVVTNNGPTTAASGTITLSTTTPTNTNYQSFAGTNWTCGTVPAVGGTGAITCTYNSALASGGTASTLTITLQVNSTATNGTVITNSATVSDSAFTDPNTSNNTSSASITVEPTGDADLQLVQNASATAVAAGSNIVLTETVTDAGPTAAGTGTITVYMQTPANTNFQSSTGTNWNCPTAPAVGGTGPVICTYNAALASGAVASALTVTFQVNTGTAAGTTIQASATVTNSTLTDPIPSNNTSISSVVVEPTASSDLALSMSVSPTPVFVSSSFTYTLQVQNLGQATAAATSNVLTDTLPSGLTNVSVSAPTGWSCSGTTTITCSSAALAQGATATISITATAPANATTLSNTATVSLSGDPNANNNTATAYTVVQPIACATPGRDGAGGTLSGVVNTYYPPASQGVLASASTSVSLGTAQGNTGKPIAAGDLVLIIQMQGSAINNTNNSSYGHGVPGDPGAGYANLGNSGLFEFVTATGFTAGTPNTLTFTGTGPTGGLLNSYSYAPASAAASIGTATAASWANNVATFTFPAPLASSVVPNAVITTTGFAPASYNVTNAPILTVNNATGVITVALTLTTNPGTPTTLGTGTSAVLGQQTYQVIRVPQYASATLSSGLVPLAWPGGTAGTYVGGVLAVDVSSQLTLGGTVALDGLGFRGGGGITMIGTTNTVFDTDYVVNSPANLPNLSGGGDPPANSGTDASKGEGVAGTPQWVVPSLFSASTFSTSSTAANTGQAVAEGLIGGSFARGAPGNAGGGGTDGDPKNNDQNSGGGAGGNGGTGGQGGYGWNSMAATNTTDGGFGGVAFPASTSALVMGGGGGAGTTNNGTYYISNSSNAHDCGLNCTGIYSSGGTGGGVAIIHAGSVVGTGTITSNGESTLSTLNDSTGGGGAGGSILVFANSGGLSGLTVNAIGGNAGNAWQIEAPGGFPGQRHGPGGGGGGGVIFLSAAPASSNVSGGANGYTDTVQDSYGATPGQSGVVVTTDIITETPGTQSGGYCGSADLSVTNSGPSVVAAGGSITYSQTVANAGPLDAVNATFSEAIPTNTTFSSVTPPSGWTCNTTPPVTTLTCTDADFAANSSGTFSVTVNVAGGTANGTEIVDVDNISSGTTDPNLSNNSATVITTVSVATQADLAVTNTVSSPTVVGGSTFTMSAAVTNNGLATATGLVFTESTASNAAGTVNATFSSITAPGWASCTTPPVGSAGTITCYLNSLNANTSAGTISIVETAPSATAGTVLSGTANIAASTFDPNYSNNSSTASIEIATAGQADLVMSSAATPNPVSVGNNITYTQSATNNGPTAITISGSNTVTFTDTIPANTTLVSFTPPSGWTCNTIAVGGTGTFTCTLNSGQTFATGSSGSVNFNMVVKVNAGTTPGTTITNSPNITSSVSDPNTTNNTATDTTVVASPSQSSVAITKTASPEPVNQGTTLTYTITVTNGGPAAATGNFTVTDALPPEVTYIPNAYSTSAGSCSGTTTVTCNIGSLAVGSTVVINIEATASSFSASAQSTNTATLTSTTTVQNAPVPLGAVTAASWASGTPNTASFTFPVPLPISLSTTSTLTTNGFSPAGYNVSNATITSVNTTTGVVTVAMATNPGTATTLGTGFAYIPYPLIAQSVSTIQAPTAVDMASVNAYSQSDGTVRVVWHTLEESRNLGFHIYREDATGQHRIDSSLIAGSALVLRHSRPQHGAKWYSWIDAHPVPNATYWIQDVDVNGTRTMHGPAYPESVSNVENQPQAAAQSVQALVPSPTLGQLRSNVSAAGPQAPRPMIPLPIHVGPFQPPAGTVPFNVADHAAVQISVQQEGWYHVPFAQLFSAGLNPSTDVRLLHLYAEGVEQPLLLTGHSAGFPALTDAIEFYGTGIDTPFSGTRVYWLVAENSLGGRVFSAPASSSAGSAGPSFPFTSILEERTTYFAALLNGENNDNFFGDVVTSDAVDELLTIAHRDTSSTQPVTLTLTLQGVTDQQVHSVAVLLNGTSVGTLDFYGMGLASQSFSVDPSLLLDGTNDVNLTALDGDNDVSLVQSVQITYLHTYTADSDYLRATASAGSEVQITGFSNPSVRLFDITNPLSIVELDGKVSTESGISTVTAPVPAGTPYTRTILAIAQDTLSTPSSLAAYTPAFLEDQRAGADIIIISHPDFASHLDTLVRLHAEQGYRVMQVTTDQLFDQFNYGERSPFAIQTFLQLAATKWQRKPQAVLLVGDASMDPRNYLGFGDFDFVPTRIIETAAFKTASDDWFTDFQQTGYPTIPTGRLPVRTLADLDAVLSKIVGYETGQSGGSWSNQAVLIADQNVDANFSAAVNAAAGTLPSSLQTTQILTDGMDQSTAHTQILQALNNGALLVDYNGHGAEQQWSFSDIFDGNDAAALTNGGHLPVYLLMDCLNGLFQDVYAEALAKSLILAPNGGAVAVWASSGFTEQPPQASMELALLTEMAAHPKEMLGLMVLRAKSGASDNDVRRTWILFGDPAMKLRISVPTVRPVTPTNPPITVHSPGICSRGISCAMEKQP